ncbi:MAG: hypothetical protein NSGCLCUN01_03583 [uncultured Clostridium sp.]
MATLNFNTIKKQYLTVTLRDEKKTTIMVCTPSKKLLSEIISIDSLVRSVSDDSTGEEEMDALYEVCAKVMSRNKGNIKIEKEMLEDIFDIEDIMIFLKSYMDFISDQAKN